MPAEKGIPKPEASAKRMDVRDYDSRTAWGWLSEDGQMIMSKEGVTYVDVELVRLSFDAFLQQYRPVHPSNRWKTIAPLVASYQGPSG